MICHKDPSIRRYVEDDLLNDLQQKNCWTYAATIVKHIHFHVPDIQLR